jgi:hypothetical protein
VCVFNLFVCMRLTREITCCMFCLAADLQPLDMASANRFALLDDEPAPKAAPVVAAAPAPAAAAKSTPPNFTNHVNQSREPIT